MPTSPSSSPAVEMPLRAELATDDAVEMPGAAHAHELESYGCKVDHWAWWVFPTDRPGASKPPPATWLTWGTARRLLNRATRQWIRCLESVCKLV